jgi:hypothetical protein
MRRNRKALANNARAFFVPKKYEFNIPFVARIQRRHGMFGVTKLIIHKDWHANCNALGYWAYSLGQQHDVSIA